MRVIHRHPRAELYPDSTNCFKRSSH